MRLVLLERTQEIGWDENIALVVYAGSAEGARELAATAASDEGASTWRDEGRSTVRELPAESSHRRILLTSFNAG